MATQSPFLWLEDTLRRLTSTLGQPPAWVVEELQRRLVALFNHVLLQEPQACSRLARQNGRVVHVQWNIYSLRLAATPAGLLDLADPLAQPDLSLSLTQTSPAALAQTLLQGEKPAVHIEGDVQLAAEVNWLISHVRWDIEEDAARLLGDAPAHALGQVVRAMTRAIQEFLGRQKNQSANPKPPL